MYRPCHSVNHSSGSKLTTPGLYRAFFIGYAHPAVDSSDVGVLSTVRRSRRDNVTVDHRRISKRFLDALHDRKIVGYLYQLWCLPYISNNNQLSWALPRISAAANRRLGLYFAISVIATRFERSRDSPLVSVHAGIGPLSRHAYTMTSTIDDLNKRTWTANLMHDSYHHDNARGPRSLETGNRFLHKTTTSPVLFRVLSVTSISDIIGYSDTLSHLICPLTAKSCK
jgi:hypothetical protein